METYSTATNTNGSEFSQAGAHAKIKGSSDPPDRATTSHRPSSMIDLLNKGYLWEKYKVQTGGPDGLSPWSSS
jgi:hypothetical protein